MGIIYAVQGGGREIRMKKIFLVLALATMMVFGNISASAADTFAWCEAEKGILNGDFVTEDNENASGGKLITLYSSEGTVHSVGITFEQEQAGEYDIWILATSPSSLSLSKYKWGINDEEYKQYTSTGENNAEVYKHKLGVVNQSLKWYRLAVKRHMDAGENVLHIAADKKAASGFKNYSMMLDCAVAVPSSYAWQPGANLDLPQRPERKFAWIELENPDNDTVFSASESEDASGKRMIHAYNLQKDTGENYETLQYSFYVDGEDVYDVWYLGCSTALMHLSPLYWNIDSEPEIDDSYRNTASTEGSIKILNSAGGDSGIALMWQKLGKRELSEGEHILYLKYKYNSLSTPGLMTWADCAAIIPSEWAWIPPSDESMNILPRFTAAYLDALGVKKTFFQNPLTAVTEDINLPSDVITVAGSTISFASDNTGVLTDSGHVIRPWYNQKDTECNLIINAELDGALSEIKIPLTVKKYDKYTVDEFAMEASEIKAKVSFNCGEQELDGRVSIVLAQTDAAGRLVEIKCVTTVLKSGENDIAMPVEVHNEASVLRAYLINNWNMGNMISDVLERTVLG